MANISKENPIFKLANIPFSKDKISILSLSKYIDELNEWCELELVPHEACEEMLKWVNTDHNLYTIHKCYYALIIFGVAIAQGASLYPVIAAEIIWKSACCDEGSAFLAHKGISKFAKDIPERCNIPYALRGLTTGLLGLLKLKLYGLPANYSEEILGYLETGTVLYGEGPHKHALFALLWSTSFPGTPLGVKETRKLA